MPDGLKTSIPIEVAGVVVCTVEVEVKPVGDVSKDSPALPSGQHTPDACRQKWQECTCWLCVAYGAGLLDREAALKATDRDALRPMKEIYEAMCSGEYDATGGGTLVASKWQDACERFVDARIKALLP